MLHRHTQKNIVLNLPYPKTEKTVPHFPTHDPYSRLNCHFSEPPGSSMGLKNLIIIILQITTKHDFIETITTRYYIIKNIISQFRL